jgi:hypothetical protein
MHSQDGCRVLVGSSCSVVLLVQLTVVAILLIPELHLPIIPYSEFDIYRIIYGQDWLLMNCQCICGFLTLEFGLVMVHYMVCAFHLCVCVLRSYTFSISVSLRSK